MGRSSRRKEVFLHAVCVVMKSLSFLFLNRRRGPFIGEDLFIALYRFSARSGLSLVVEGPRYCMVLRLLRYPSAIVTH